MPLVPRLVMEFLKNLDSDLKSALKAQLRDLWTHTSTAIEGNTLTLGETKFVIEEGLTVSGKPLKESLLKRLKLLEEKEIYTCYYLLVTCHSLLFTHHLSLFTHQGNPGAF